MFSTVVLQVSYGVVVGTVVDDVEVGGAVVDVVDVLDVVGIVVVDVVEVVVVVAATIVWPKIFIWSTKNAVRVL